MEQPYTVRQYRKFFTKIGIPHLDIRDKYGDLRLNETWKQAYSDYTYERLPLIQAISQVESFVPPAPATPARTPVKTQPLLPPAKEYPALPPARTPLQKPEDDQQGRLQRPPLECQQMLIAILIAGLRLAINFIQSIDCFIPLILPDLAPEYLPLVTQPLLPPARQCPALPPAKEPPPKPGDGRRERSQELSLKYQQLLAVSPFANTSTETAGGHSMLLVPEKADARTPGALLQRYRSIIAGKAVICESVGIKILQPRFCGQRLNRRQWGDTS
ncbi:MAG: hypothetical protein F6K39_30295 [Okeania sp. SIO3B3]|nr:hypothetical protein [Okeania sp. SIO3B3]